MRNGVRGRARPGGHVDTHARAVLFHPHASVPAAQGSRSTGSTLSRWLPHRPLSGPVAMSPELWGPWYSQRRGEQRGPRPDCTCCYHSLSLPPGAGPPSAFPVHLVPGQSADLVVGQPASAHPPQLALPMILRVTQDAQQVPSSAPSDSALNLPVTHHLHVHQPGLSRHHLWSRPVLWPPPPWLPCFSSQPHSLVTLGS